MESHYILVYNPDVQTPRDSGSGNLHKVSLDLIPDPLTSASSFFLTVNINLATNLPSIFSRAIDPNVPLQLQTLPR